MQAAFEHKPAFQFRDFVIEKTVELPSEWFEHMLRHPMASQDFLKENAGLMHQDGMGVNHCLLVTGEGRSDGLLVESEGYDYARYAAYVPEATVLASPALRELNNRMNSAVKYMVAIGTKNTTQGNWRIGFDELAQRTGFEHDFNSVDTLMDMLREQEAVADAELLEDGIEVKYHLGFCPNYESQPEEDVPESIQPKGSRPTLRDLIQIPMEDIHLLHSDEEIEPATIVELSAHTLTDTGKEAWADVLDAKVCRIYQGIYGLQMELEGVKPSRLQSFSTMLAGCCSEEIYEKWVAQPKESLVPSPKMKL